MPSSPEGLGAGLAAERARQRPADRAAQRRAGRRRPAAVRPRHPRRASRLPCSNPPARRPRRPGTPPAGRSAPARRSARPRRAPPPRANAGPRRGRRPARPHRVGPGRADHRCVVPRPSPPHRDSPASRVSIVDAAYRHRRSPGRAELRDDPNARRIAVTRALALTAPGAEVTVAVSPADLATLSEQVSGARVTRPSPTRRCARRRRCDQRHHRRRRAHRRRARPGPRPACEVRHDHRARADQPRSSATRSPWRVPQISGRVEGVRGLSIRVRGLSARVGDLVTIESSTAALGRGRGGAGRPWRPACRSESWPASAPATGCARPAGR